MQDKQVMRMPDQAAALDRIEKLAREGKIDRRQFIQSFVAAGLGAAAVGQVAFNATKAHAAPKRGGTFRVAMDDSNTTDNLDPGTTESQHMIQMNHAIRSYLTEINEDNVVGPDAAASWEASPDAAQWTFKLKKGIEFHNGKSFTAQDAMDSLNYHRGDTKSAAKPLLESVTDIKTDGDDTIVVTLGSGSADFPYVLTDYHLVMMPSDGEGNVDFKSGIGTGAYAIKSHNPGVESLLERHPNYWKEGRGWFDGVQILGVNDPNARQTAIKTGDVDAATEPDLKTIHLLGRDPNLVVVEVPSGAHVTIPMFVDQAPFDNKDLRLALKYGINREEILKKITLGHGTIGNDHPIGPTLPYWADLEQRKYDPDKAKHHLKKAGMEGIKLDLSTADAAFPGAVDMVILYKEHLAPAGIDLTVVREANDGYWSNVWLNKPFVVVGWGARPTPDVMFSLAYAKGAAWNESHYAGERFNELLVQARAELDDAKRTEMYREMQQIMRDDGGTIVPFFRNRVYVHKKSVMHGDKLTGNWTLDGGRAYERWWFA